MGSRAIEGCENAWFSFESEDFTRCLVPPFWLNLLYQ